MKCQQDVHFSHQCLAMAFTYTVSAYFLHYSLFKHIVDLFEPGCIILSLHGQLFISFIKMNFKPVM